MHQGTHNESNGFTLDSLLKLTHVKGNDKKTTLLDYVTRHVESKHGKACLDLATELQDIEAASKFNLSQVRMNVYACSSARVL